MSGSWQYGNLSSQILRETYGSAAEKIAMTLFRCGPRTLHQLVNSTRMPTSKVVKTLKGLCNYNLVIFNETVGSPVTYSLQYDYIIFTQRYIRSVPLLTSRFGSEGEMLLDVLQKNGRETASGLVLNAADRLIKTKQATGAESKTEEIVILMYDKLMTLIDQGFVCRASQSLGDSDEFTLPELNLGELTRKLESNTIECKDQKDYSILWKIKATRITNLLRDEMMAEALTSRIDSHAGTLARAALSLVTDYDHTARPNFSQQVSIHELRTRIQKQFPDSILLKYLEDYLQVVTGDSSRFLKQTDYAIKMEYTITLKSALEELVWTAIERSVQEQFGSNGVHVFRVVRLQRYADQDQIQEAVMLTAKETKQITYRLMAHNLLQVRELKLTGSLSDTGGRGGATTYLFCINLKQVVRMFLEKCYIAQYAAMTRQNEVLLRYKYLFTKQQQMEAYRSVEVAPEELFDDLLTPIEREELDKVRVWRDRLNHAACDIDESIMLFELFLQASLLEETTGDVVSRKGKKNSAQFSDLLKWPHPQHNLVSRTRNLIRGPDEVTPFPTQPGSTRNSMGGPDEVVQYGNRKPGMQEVPNHEGDKTDTNPRSSQRPDPARVHDSLVDQIRRGTVLRFVVNQDQQDMFISSIKLLEWMTIAAYK